MVVPSPLGWEPIPASRRRPWRWGVGFIVALIVAVAALNAVTVSYYEILPGDALPVNGPGGPITVNKQHVGSGDVLLATVYLQSKVTAWARLTDFLHPDDSIVSEVSITGGATTTQYNNENAQAMAASQQDAEVAALRRLGYTVPEVGDGAAVMAVENGTPAAGQLRPGDVITAVNGKPIKIETDLTTAISTVKAGALVTVQVSRPGPTSNTTVVLHLRTIPCGIETCPDDPTRPLVGVEVMTDRQKFLIPPDVPVAIQTSGIGGPSAGLAFTLGVIDALTSKDITGGNRVAATGAIDQDGNVGDVGGVKQKTITVINEHCKYFIVPTVEATTARKAAHGRITIVPVDNLNEALAFLASIHGDLSGVPTTPPPAAG
jgi:PDZ domain-containing protein